MKKTKKLKIQYDPNYKLMMVSPSIWSATGPAQWFLNYRIIATLKNPLEKKLNVVNFEQFIKPNEIVPQKVDEIISSTVMPRIITENSLHGYDLLVGKSKDYKLQTTYLKNKSVVAENYENKVWLRENFAGTLNFPSFKIITFNELCNQDFTKLANMFNSSAVVVQHARLSGSSGTHIINNNESYNAALTALGLVIKDLDEKLVVSKAIEGFAERSLQICLAQGKIFVGAPQGQLIGHPKLVPNTPGIMQYCGGRIDTGLMTDAQYREASGAARLVGEALIAAGYKGIFGIDFLVNSEGVYPIEVNPRLTVISTLLSFLQEEVPFLLLHILELAQEEYQIHEFDSNSQTMRRGSYVILYAHEDSIVNIETGVYDKDLNKISDGFDDMNILPEKDGHYFVGLRSQFGAKVTAGKSVAIIYARHQLFDDHNSIDPGLEKIIQKATRPQN